MTPPTELPSAPDLRIVLCRPSHPGNIGAAARALYVMGLSRLDLVTPRIFPSDEATTRATGAEPILGAARVWGSLPEAVQDCAWVIGLTARARREGPRVADIADAARVAVARTASGPVALVFGNERTGLTGEELQACHALAHIPTGPAMSSLNLGAAVQVACYEVNRARMGIERPREETVEPPTPEVRGGPARQAITKPAPRATVDAFVARLWEAFGAAERFRPDDARVERVRERIRRLLDRAQPTEAELKAAHGALKWLTERE